MARVVVMTALPGLRLGLTTMLASRGHFVLEGDADGSPLSAVWVLDAPSSGALSELRVGAADERPNGLVVLTDDALVAAEVPRLARGGWACLPREADQDDLDLAVRGADAGLAVLDLALAARLVGEPRPPETRGDPLTAREHEVLALVADGLANKAIAYRLGISENTAKFHVASLTAKLGAATRAEAVAIAARRGLLIL